MKLHLGAGTVYLKDYVNVDASPYYLANDVPIKVLQQNTTTIDKYYKFDFCEGSGVCVADVEANVDDLPFKDESCEEVVIFHVLEHIPEYKVGNVLNEINRVLKLGGKLMIAVPDLKETARGLSEAKNDEEEDWHLRLIYGTQRNEFSHHYCGYTKRTLIKLLSFYNFGEFKSLPNINFYPAIHLSAIKESE